MKDVLAAVVAIAIAGAAVVDAAQAAVLEEVTVVATPVVVAADADEGRIRLASCQQHEGRSDAALFVLQSSERQALEDGFRDPLDGGHDVAPDFWCVKDVGGAPFKGAYDVAGNLLRIGEACGVGQVIGHGSLHRSGLDGDDTDAGRMQAAAESLEKE